MKIRIEVDCEPQEARAFLGLPDVEAFQRETVEQVGKRMKAYFETLDPERLARMWMPAGAEAWDSMQKAFSRFAGAAAPDRE